jgi:hypothetical protein
MGGGGLQVSDHGKRVTLIMYQIKRAGGYLEVRLWKMSLNTLKNQYGPKKVFHFLLKI